MRAVAQRVERAAIRVAGETVGAMGPGLLALVGVGRGDGPEAAAELASRLVHLRVFEDAEGRMNRALLETGGALGVVSQFTLFGDARKGRRPSFVEAASPEQAEPLVRVFADALSALGATVATGVFGAHMDVELVNDGPVTLMLEVSA